MLIPVHADLHDYDIVIEPGVLQDAGRYLPHDGKLLIVTDDGVPPAYAAALKSVSASPTLVTLPAGEATKSVASYAMLLETMLSAGFSRSDAVVAVGGGVVGDLAGFAASTYMRGIDFYNIPTTLLSQVDSSIGGKTAIDLAGAKNVVGSFYVPSRVLIDPTLLDTLPSRELRAGLAEVIKMAATSDAALFSLLETTGDLRAALPTIIHRSLLIKKNVVENDLREKGLRRVLNFGHTVGHAIESATQGALKHGECVAIGMLPMSGKEAGARIAALLEKYGLPTSADVTAADILTNLTNDKKRSGTHITAVWVDEIGSFTFRQLLPDEILACVERSSILTSLYKTK